jgi:hypothetical protein
MRIMQSCAGRPVFVQKSALLVMLPKTIIRLVDSFIEGAESSATALSRGFHHAGSAF